MGELQIGLVGAVMIAAPLYIKYEDPIVPAVGLALGAAILFPILPGEIAGIAWVILFMGLTMGVFTAMYRTVLT